MTAYSPKHSAFSLVEVVMALGVFAFSVVLIFGLLPTALHLDRASQDESEAIRIMSALINDRRCTPRTQVSAIYSFPPLTSALSATTTVLYFNAENTVCNLASAIYKADCAYLPPAQNSGTPYLMWCRISWPANAATPKGTVEAMAAIPQSTPTPR